jgi:steroid Delta-isomerase
VSTLRIEDIVRYFETITPDSLADMGRVYTEDAYFKDPFNEVKRLEDIRAIFERMFEGLVEPRFEIVNRIVDGDQVMLEWNFTFRVRRWKPETVQLIHGVSHLRLAPDGRIAYHRDYWDVADELYSKLPLIGGLMRFLRSKMG